MKLINSRIVRPSIDQAEAFVRAYEDYFAADETKWIEFYKPGVENFAKYIEELNKLEKAENLPDGWVAESTRWLLNEQGDIVGFIRVRHGLTLALEEEVGHIGYDVPPTQRGKGFGHACLQGALEVARELMLEKVLLICDSDNLVSKKIIEAANAQFQDQITPAGESFTVCRYWMKL